MQHIIKHAYNMNTLIQHSNTTRSNAESIYQYDRTLPSNQKVRINQLQFQTNRIRKLNKRKVITIQQERNMKRIQFILCNSLGILLSAFGSNYSRRPKSFNKSKIVSNKQKRNKLKKGKLSTVQQEINTTRIQFI